MLDVTGVNIGEIESVEPVFGLGSENSMASFLAVIVLTGFGHDGFLVFDHSSSHFSA